MVTIEPNARGGYSIRIAGAGRAIGNYATRADAERIARLSGYAIKKMRAKSSPQRINQQRGGENRRALKKRQAKTFKKSTKKTGDIENGK